MSWINCSFYYWIPILIPLDIFPKYCCIFLLILHMILSVIILNSPCTYFYYLSCSIMSFRLKTPCIISCFPFIANSAPYFWFLGVTVFYIIIFHVYLCHSMFHEAVDNTSIILCIKLVESLKDVLLNFLLKQISVLMLMFPHLRYIDTKKISWGFLPSNHTSWNWFFVFVGSILVFYHLFH